VSLTPLFVAGTAQSAVGTTLSMTFTQMDGITPVANASVAAFYMQPADSDKPVGTVIHLARLGSGTTDSHGRFSTVLDTSAIKPSDLGDGGDGTADAFNVLVIAADHAGHQALVPEIVRMNKAFVRRAKVTLQSSPAASTSVPVHISARLPIIGKTYRYSPATPLNSGAGMHTVFKFTVSRSIKRETKVNITTEVNGSWSVGDMSLEEKDRSLVAPYRVKGDFHKWVWARYKYVKYATRLENFWQVNHFTGDLKVKNPDKRKGKTIGVVKYKVPHFNRGPGGAYFFKLTKAKSGWTRSSGTRKENNANATFVFPDAGSLGINDITTYAAITSVKYNWARGCSSGHSRVIWGWNDDPAEVPRVEANCLPNSELR
jgi:hypothetical protein